MIRCGLNRARCLDVSNPRPVFAPIIRMVLFSSVVVVVVVGRGGIGERRSSERHERRDFFMLGLRVGVS